MGEYAKSFLYSTPVVIGAVSLSLTFGTLIAKKLVRTRRSGFVKATLSLVIFTPHFVFAWVVYGLAGSSLFLQKSGITTILAYVLKETPFVVLYLSPTLEKISKAEYETLAVMGAGRLGSYLTADFPRLFPVYAEVIMILTAFTYTAYEIPALLGVTYPKFLGVLIFDTYFKYSAAGRSAAICAMAVFTLVMVVFGGVLFFVSNKFKRES